MLASSGGAEVAARASSPPWNAAQMGEDVQPVLCVSGVIAAASSPLPLVLLAGFFLEQIVNTICHVCCLEDGLVDAIRVSLTDPSEG